MKLIEPRLDVAYVDNLSALEALLADLKTQDRLAIDAERASGFRYSQKAYLIQIATNSKIYLIDPLSLSAESNAWSKALGEAMYEKTWLLHAATQDLPCLLELGIRPSRLIDTELAARLAGIPKVGLGSLCLELLEIELLKEHSASDWSTRPLSDEMKNYAALDVDVMFELWEQIRGLLESQGKLEWAEQEFSNLVHFQAKPPPEEPWRNLPGISKIKDLRKLQIAAALHQARDSIARDTDVAPGRLIPDRSIMAAVEQLPNSKSELASNKEFQGRASRSMLGIWWKAIEDSKELDISLAPRERGSGIPNHRSWEKRFPEAYSRLEIIRPALLDLATKLGLPIENLLTPDYLRRVCFSPSFDIEAQLLELGARRWQIELCAEPIRVGLEKVALEASREAASPPEPGQ